MRLSDLVRRGTLGALGIVGCGGEIDRQPFLISSHIDPLIRFLRFPELHDLKVSVSYFDQTERDKKDLQEQADYGKRFHSSVSLFIGNYTLGVSDGWWEYAFEHGNKIERWEVEKLRSTAWAIRHNGEKNDDYTLRRCTAAEELYGIMEKAEKEDHLDEAAKVIGYLSLAAERMHSLFSGFGFFYEHDSNNESPKNILGWYKRDAAEIRTMMERAWHKWDYLSESLRDELTMWIGRYGHEALAGTTSQTVWFRDNQPDRETRERVLPDRETREKVLPNIPAAPATDKDDFYERCGRELLRGYGVLAKS